MASGFLTGMAAKSGAATLSSAQSFPLIPCLDWVIPGMCSFTCKHCHPETGIKAAKVHKMYYCLVGESLSQAGVMTIPVDGAVALAQAINRGTVKSGARVEVFGKIIRVVEEHSLETYPYPLAPSLVRAYLTNAQLHSFPEGAPQRVWFGEHFCGLGMLQFHNDRMPDQRDIAALHAKYSEEVIRTFMREDDERRA